MLLNQEIITAVEQIEALRINNLVVDPVMVSRTVQLIDDAAGSNPSTSLWHLW